MRKLTICNEGKCKERSVFYNRNEIGLDTAPEVQSDISLLVAYVNIGFDVDDMCANQIFGLSPDYSWKRRKLYAPEHVATAYLKLDEDIDYGTIRLDRGDEWKTYYDEGTGWLCVGNPEPKVTVTNVNFLKNAIAVLSDQGELIALWIKPLFDVE